VATPVVSVVIPTLAREARLQAALDALAAQTLGRESFEVIVVRAASSPPGELAEAPPGLEVTFLRSPVAGAAAQRNVGWRSARGEFVAFTDDDCRPAPDWLERLLEARAPETIVQGRTEPDPEERGALRGYARSMTVPGYDPWSATCNIAYPRPLLERVDGFDERFPGAWGEDTDLALRAIEAGARQVFVADALVWHAVHSRNLAGALRESVGRSNIHRVIARHPAQRAALYRGVFASRSHAFLLLSLLGVIVARRHPLLRVLALAPFYYAYFDREADWTPTLVARWTLFSVPKRSVVDVTEVVAMAISSARFRTLVL
jgi:GT2 family glycosyltransferase